MSYETVRETEGGDREITCEAVSYPLPKKVVWSHYDGKKFVEIKPNEKFSFSESSNNIANGILKIRNITSDSEGYYKCATIDSNAADNAVYLLRVRNPNAIYWPLIGIAIEVLILLITILVYEKRQYNKHKAEKAKEDKTVADEAAQPLMQSSNDKSGDKAAKKKHKSQELTRRTSGGPMDFFKKRISQATAQKSSINLESNLSEVDKTSLCVHDYLGMSLEPAKIPKNRTDKVEKEDPNTVDPRRFLDGPSNKIRKKFRGLFMKSAKWRHCPVMLCEEMHRIWINYARALDINPCKNELVLRMDLLGARIAVIRSLAVRKPNFCGIVVSETRNQFYLADPSSIEQGIVKKNELKDAQLRRFLTTDEHLCKVSAIPKQGTLFQLLLPVENGAQQEKNLFLVGSQLLHRPLERFNRKWKSSDMGCLVQPKAGSGRRCNASRKSSLAKRAEAFTSSGKAAINYPLEGDDLFDNFAQ
ncbi:hypothetical protein Ciccas_010444 [Cichlidogyrus casuarinus]|uniref:Ribonuclease P protein subunit p29 n=1 Tax=Cichlidogyrus casuarinus TaxID=1844966 RepID=A0ABD2PU42_9PLAT